MNKDSYEFALTLTETSPKRFNSGGVPVRLYFTAEIEGKRISRSSRWWAEWHRETSDKPLFRTEVGQRVSRGWNEQNACLAKRGENETAYLKRINKAPLFDGENKDDIVNKYLSMAW